MKRKTTYLKISRIISAIVFTMVVFSGSVMAQGWTIYDASVVPLENVAPVFTRSNVSVSNEVFDTWSTIIVDPADEDNYLLQFVDNATAQRGMWRTNISGTKLTLVTRIKAYDLALDWTIDIDVEFSGTREQFFIMNNNKLHLRRGVNTIYDLPIDFDLTEWNTFRFVFDTEAVPKTVSVYLNEDTTPFLSELAPATVTGTNNYFRFGNGDNNRTVGYVMDWIIWDTSGAYAPGAGTAIPSPVVTPSWNADLAELNVDGSLLGGFSASTLSYEVVLPKGTVVVPTVTAVADDSEADIDITPAAGIPGTTTVLVTAENGVTTKTYNVAFRIVSEDASLSGISVDGEPIADFDSETLSYTVYLPLETTEDISVVTATATHPNADVQITQATEIDGEATILVTAEDGETEQTYTVDFVLVSIDATLSDLLVDDVTVTGFDPEVLVYFVFLPDGTTEPPVVTAVANNENATLDITQATEIPGTATILVTAEDGDTQETYTITFLEGSDDATLSDLMVDGVTVVGFDPEVVEYFLLLPSEVVVIPVISAVANDVNATFEIIQAAEIPGAAVVTVTAEDNFNQLVYTVNMRYASDDASLSELLINGSSIISFDPEVEVYNITLPIYSTVIPTITATASDELASVEITPAAQIPGATLVVVTAEDGVAVTTYTVNFVEGDYNWRYYDASVLPHEHVPAFITSSSAYNPDESKIIVDPDNEDNKLLWMDIPTASTQFYWRMNFVNHNLQVDDLTVVMRIKGHPDRDLALDLDLHYNDIRARVSFFNEFEEQANVARIRNGTGDNVSLSVNIQEWNTYRFTMNENEVNLYVNENPIPELTFVPQASASTNRHFRFGDGDSGNNFGADIDWVIWDITGAYAPGEGLFVPEEIVTPNWDASLETFTLGEEDVLEIYGIEVQNPATDKGAFKYVENFTTFIGMEVVPVQEVAELIVTINGVVVEDNFDTQTFEADDVILVTLKAEDGFNAKYYKVTLTDEELNDEAEILTFNIDDQIGETVIDTEEATVTVLVAYGVNVTTLTPTITISQGAIILPDGGTVQNFTNPFVYTVIAEDGLTKKEWTVTINIEEPNDDATLTDLLVDGVTVEGFVSETYEYNIELPAGTTDIPVVTAVASDVNATINITQAPQLPGTSVVKVTAEDGIAELEYVINFTVATSVGSTESLSLKLYPNPATHAITVEWPEAFSGADVRVICTSGRIVMQKRVESSSEVIDISNLMPGVYIMHIVSNNVQARKLFIKQ